MCSQQQLTDSGKFLLRLEGGTPDRSDPGVMLLWIVEERGYQQVYLIVDISTQ